MKRVLVFTFLAWLLSSYAARSLRAQDLVITNARIVVGNGTVINSGSIVVKAGKIVFVAPGPANAPGMQTNTMDFAPYLIPQGANIKATVETIDAKGMTVMPGFIASAGVSVCVRVVMLSAIGGHTAPPLVAT